MTKAQHTSSKISKLHPVFCKWTECEQRQSDCRVYSAIHLLWVVEVSHESIIVSRCHSLRKTCHYLDIRLQRPLQQFVYHTIVIIVVPDSKQRVDVVPDGTTEWSCVNVDLVTHPVTSINGDISGYRLQNHTQAADLFCKQNCWAARMSQQKKSLQQKPTLVSMLFYTWLSSTCTWANINSTKQKTFSYCFSNVSLSAAISYKVDLISQHTVS